jgi:hypothetical protein
MFLREITRRRSSLARLFLAALCMAMAVAPARAILINGEGPDTVTGIYDRFIVGTYPGAPVPNPAFIGSSLNLSGVGWSAANPDVSITMISSQYFVGAAHYMPAVGTTLEFEGTDHLLYTATVASYQALNYTGTGGAQSSDLSVGRLTTPLPAAVTPMPIFYAGVTNISDPASFDAYDGVSLFNYGRTARMGTNTVSGFTEYSFSSGPATNIGLLYTQGAGAGSTLLQSGDSGSPTIAYEDGVYGLIGTASGVDTPDALSADAFVSYTPYVDQLETILGTDGQSLTFAIVPEPGTILFGFALLGICASRRTRRARD